MFIVNNKDTTTTPFAIGVVLMSFLLTLKYFTHCSSAFIINFEQVNAVWVKTHVLQKKNVLRFFIVIISLMRV